LQPAASVVQALRSLKKTRLQMDLLEEELVQASWN
jgi:hypothetical protein